MYWKSTEKSIEENRLNKPGNSNVVHKFSEDYFDLEEDNVIDRSDTYMTHIKGKYFVFFTENFCHYNIKKLKPQSSFTCRLCYFYLFQQK